MSSYEVKEVGFDDLSDDEKNGASCNGSGKEYASYLRITYNGATIGLYSDAMEPEDCRFYRDLSWIVPALLEAYLLGEKK